MKNHPRGEQDPRYHQGDRGNHPVVAECNRQDDDDPCSDPALVELQAIAGDEHDNHRDESQEEDCGDC
eukprot:3346954-Pyramimonas_sp.AAC.2